MDFATLMTKEQINYLRLHSLLVNVGTNTLRRLFDKFHSPAILQRLLKDNEIMLRYSLRANAAQQEKLFSSPPSSVTSETFDLPLLMILFRLTREIMLKPTKGWGTLPPDLDRSVTANLVRVEYYRRKVFPKASQMSVDDTTFNDLWQKISRALIELGADETVINRLKTGSKDPEEVKRDSGNINKKTGRLFILYFFFRFYRPNHDKKHSSSNPDSEFELNPGIGKFSRDQKSIFIKILKSYKEQKLKAKM